MFRAKILLYKISDVHLKQLAFSVSELAISHCRSTRPMLENTFLLASILSKDFMHELAAGL